MSYEYHGFCQNAMYFFMARHQQPEMDSNGLRSVYSPEEGSSLFTDGDGFHTIFFFLFHASHGDNFVVQKQGVGFKAYIHSPVQHVGGSELNTTVQLDRERRAAKVAERLLHS